MLPLPLGYPAMKVAGAGLEPALDIIAVKRKLSFSFVLQELILLETREEYKLPLRVTTAFRQKDI
jgi:hypothetical protein